MTRNDHLNKLEWSIRPRSGVDSAQWDWGIRCHSTCHHKDSESIALNNSGVPVNLKVVTTSLPSVQIACWWQGDKLIIQHDTLLDAGADVRNLPISITYWMLVLISETYQSAWYPIECWCRCQKLTNQHDTLLEAGADVRNFPISIIPYEKANFTPLHWFKMVDL